MDMLPSVMMPAAQGGRMPTGEDAPTLNWTNPVWARYFDMLKKAAGGTQPAFAMRSDLQQLPQSQSLAALQKVVQG